MVQISRRTMLAGTIAVGAAGPGQAETVMLPFANGERPLVAYPQKRPLIRMTTRPPQLETPFAVYDEGVLTPNDAFFVRYHLADVPVDRLDPQAFRLELKGKVARPQSLTLAALKSLGVQDLVAVNQCSGNGRGFFEPRVAGGQAANGLMGNARWRGVPLRAVLDRAGVQAGAVEVRFDGMDGPVAPDTPDFAKSLTIDHARDGDVMLAWAMNGADLLVLNGFPLRLVVPGWFGTYWVKHLNEITVLDTPLDNFWMSTAYRVPDNDCQCVAPGTAPAKTRPIGRLAVRSFVTSHQDGARLPAGQQVGVRGIAFDGGSGIAEVKLSTDGGATWMSAQLGEDLGRFSFRGWQAAVRLPAGRHAISVQAIARSGETQPMEPRWNPSGYLRNVIETVAVEAV